MRAELDANPAAHFVGLVRIGVDETSYKKGHKYITVVINHDTGKVIWAHEGHGKTIFTKFFKLLSKEATAVFVQDKESQVASSSNSFVKRDLCLAQGTDAVTTPCLGHMTRCISATI